MEEARKIHKETPWLWAEVLKDWRRSRTRRRLRTPAWTVTPQSR